MLPLLRRPSVTGMQRLNRWKLNSTFGLFDDVGGNHLFRGRSWWHDMTCFCNIVLCTRLANSRLTVITLYKTPKGQKSTLCVDKWVLALLWVWLHDLSEQVPRKKVITGSSHYFIQWESMFFCCCCCCWTWATWQRDAKEIALWHGIHFVFHVWRWYTNEQVCEITQWCCGRSCHVMLHTAARLSRQRSPVEQGHRLDGVLWADDGGCGRSLALIGGRCQCITAASAVWSGPVGGWFCPSARSLLASPCASMLY